MNSKYYQLSDENKLAVDAYIESLSEAQSFGEWVHMQRVKYQLKRTHLASTSGLHVSTLRYIEDGSHKPYPKTMEYIRKALKKMTYSRSEQNIVEGMFE